MVEMAGHVRNEVCASMLGQGDRPCEGHYFDRVVEEDSSTLSICRVVTLKQYISEG